MVLVLLAPQQPINFRLGDPKRGTRASAEMDRPESPLLDKVANGSGRHLQDDGSLVHSQDLGFGLFPHLFRVHAWQRSTATCSPQLYVAARTYV